MVSPDTLPAALVPVRALLSSDDRRRILIGVVGPPAAGKSTLAVAMASALARESIAAVALGMDGFHLANEELERLGLANRKGAPATFDAEGFIHLLRRLRELGPATIYAPVFNRTLNESIGSAVPVRPAIRVVVVEGNYLLLETPPWNEVRSLFDLVLYLDAPARVRRPALLRRQRNRGLDSAAALAWVDESDEANARLIVQTRDRADLVLCRGA
ncbi:MAG: nucleoside/nucleotide kinase family protein [Micromonosporaceae bacterium]|nr:nucleoside/nucleotide kinase family protein [Micromonosporaceae bacterium]